MTQIPQLPPHIDVQDDDLLVVRQSDNKDHKVPVAALSKGNVRYVQTIDDLRAVNGMQDGQATEIVSTGRAGLFRWSSADLSAEVAADPMSGIYVAPTGQDGSQGAWKRVYNGTLSVDWFGADPTGSNDSTPSFQAAVDFFGYTPATPGVRARNGGSIVVGRGEYHLHSAVQVLNNVWWSGEGTESRIMVHDRGFVFGRNASQGGRVDVIGGIKKMMIKGAVGSEGHVSTLYGSTNSVFAFTSRSTTQAGYRLNGTSNVSTIGVVLEGVYAPMDVSDCYFYGLDIAVAVRAQYSPTIQKNRIWYCNVGIETTGIITTADIMDNIIERCAVGVFMKYPCSFMRIDHNVIEANYGGCDILIFNQGEDIEITRNYFEASPSGIVVRADSSLPYAPHKLYIERNTGIRAHFRLGQVAYVTFKDNWINEVNFELFPGATSSLRNILFDGNYDGPSERPMDISRVIFNSVAQPFAKYVEFRGNGYDLAGESIPAYLPQLGWRKSQAYRLSHTHSAPSTTFKISVPNRTLTAVLYARGIKYRGDADYTVRDAAWRLTIRRIAGQDAVVIAELLHDTEIEIPDAAPMDAVSAPVATVSGAAAEGQEIDFRLTNGRVGGSSASWNVEAQIATTDYGVGFV